MNSKSHWEMLYNNKKPTEVSWYQNDPVISLEMISSTRIGLDQKILDVGGGSSILADTLLRKGFQDITVLDISLKGIQYAQERLYENAQRIKWVVSDITEFEPTEHYDLWHDRAVFHFFRDPQDREKYVRIMEKVVKPGGHVIIATFSLDGPLKCNGLDVERYDIQKMKKELGSSFELWKSVGEVHTTPRNKEQRFIYCYFRKLKKD